MPNRLPLLPLIIILVSVPALGQGHGGGAPKGTTSHVDPATNGRNAAVLGKGNDLDLSVRPSSAADEPRVEFRTGQASLSFTRPVPQDQLASVRANGVDFRNALQLTPGKYTVRFVVRDNVTGKVGSVTAPLTVN
jgi:hypothetical protein